VRATAGLRKALGGAVQAGQMDEKTLRNFERIAQDVIRACSDLETDRDVLKTRLRPLIEDLFSAADQLGIAPGRAVLDGALLVSVLPQAGRES